MAVSLPHRGWPEAAPTTGPAHAAIGWLPGVPEPSRRPTASGSSTGAPLAAAARAGAAPAQAKTRASSPLRKRWQRTPPVARPLARVLRERRDLDRARLGAGQRGRRAGDGDHDRRRRGSTDAEPRARDSPSASRTPAMPPPERPWGRTPSAPKCSSWASVVMKHRVSSPVCSSTAPTTSSPSLSPITSQSRLGEHLGVDPLDHALPGAERQPGPVGRAASRGPAPARRARAPRTRRPGAPPARCGSLADGGQRGQLEHAEPDDAAGAGEQRRPRRGRWPAPPTRSRRAWPGRRRSPGGSSVGRARQQPARGEVDEARVVGDLERARPR